MLGAAVSRLLPAAIGWGMKKFANTSWGSKALDFLDNLPNGVLSKSAGAIMRGVR